MFTNPTRDTMPDMKRSQALFAGIVFVSLLMGIPGNSWSEDTVVRIATGGRGFTYRSVYAPNLEKLMPGYKFVYLPSEGSGQNIDLLAAGKADIAFSQSDVYAVKESQEPNRFKNVLPIGQIAPECIYIARQARPPKTTLEEMAGKGSANYAVIAIGNYNGGMLWSWAYLQSLIAGLDNVRASEESGTLALNHLAFGSLDAVGWISDPNNSEHKMLKAVQANEGLELMPLTNPALTAARADGSPVYEALKVPGGPKGKGPEIQTICTSAMIFTRKDAPPQLIEKLSDLVSLSKDKIAPVQKR